MTTRTTSEVVGTLPVLALFATIGALDVWSGADVTLRALYLLPVAAAAWWRGRATGLAVSGAAVALALYVDLDDFATRLRPTFVYSDAAVRLGVYVAAVLVLSALREAQARLAGLADTDPLTGLHNRRGLLRHAAPVIARARRVGTALTLAVIDLDGFKALNDTRGHVAGDHALAAVGAALAAGRTTDLAARLGGDEFALLLCHADEHDAGAALARLRHRLHAAAASAGDAVGFSVGAITYADAPPPIEVMIAAADELMYDVKRAGGRALVHRTVTREGAAPSDLHRRAG